MLAHTVRAGGRMKTIRPLTPADDAATVNPEAGAATTHRARYRLNPSPESKTEVEAALEALDDEIDRLEDHADAPSQRPGARRPPQARQGARGPRR